MMMKGTSFVALLVGVSFSTSHASGVAELTLDNFESQLSGKNGFVKFLAPW